MTPIEISAITHAFAVVAGVVSGWYVHSHIGNTVAKGIASVQTDIAAIKAKISA